MTLISRFFLLDSTPPDQLLGSAHNPWLVLLSVLVAVVTCYVALSLSDRAREAPTRQLRVGALAAGALSLGGGVWTMHFIGMLAFQFCGQVDYDPLWTLGSMLPSLGAAWAALRGLTRQRVSVPKLLWGGVWMGGGIGLMHYGGMAAVRSSAQLRYEPLWFMASIVVAVALSTLALWLHHRLRRALRLDRRLRTLLTACILGGAISGMHYTAMGAARFIGQADANANAQTPLHVELALAVALMALVVSVIAVGLNAALVQRQLMRDRVRSEVRLQALVDTAVDGVVRMDGQGRIVAANHAAEGIFGLPQAALAGQALSQLVPALAGITATEPHFAGVLESTACRADGQDMRLRVALGHSNNGGERQSVAFVTDITEAQRRKAELEGVQAAIRRALVVVEFDMAGRVLSANDAFLALTGHTAESLYGQHHSVLCSNTEASRADDAELWSALRRGQFRTGDYERVGRDGRQIWIHATYNPILDGNGLPLRIVKFVNDLTERHVMEQDLRQAMVRAEQAAAAKSTFLANMSHEIRTPMNAIIGFSEVALDGPLAPDARQHLHIIHRSARSLLGLLNDILDTAKLDHGAVELEQQDFSLRQLCSDVMATLRIGAERKGLQLTLAVNEQVPDFHRGDPMRLQQILINLVGNAVKFTDEGAVTLAARVLDNGALEVSVQDTGIGIAADRLERIFDPFAQADATMTRRFGGTGLGTTIARQLVTLMGGEIGAASTPGQGSRFWFRLPLQIGQAPVAGGQAVAGVVLPPLRILAADDVPENLRLLELRLGAMGHTLTLAHDGQHALDRMTEGGFDIALLDVQMPRLDGLQACRQLRAHEAAQGAPRLPILALTASATEDDRSLTSDAGMDGFVVKPIDWPVLLREMACALGLNDTGSAIAAPGTAGPDASAVASSAAATATAAATAADAADAAESTSPRSPHAAPERSPDPRATPSAVPAPLALPEAVDWPQALARWGEPGLWREQLQRFLRATLQDWPAAAAPPSALGAAFAHKLRGACANFGLTDLAEVCHTLEHLGPAAASSRAAPAGWPALHARLAALHEALPPDPDPATAASLTPTLTPTDPPGASVWPQAAATALRDALARGELPDAIYRHVLHALPTAPRERLRDAVDGFDFDQAQALLARYAQELA